MSMAIAQVLGWEEATTFPGPPDIVGAPPLVPAPLSIVTSCPVLDVNPDQPFTPEGDPGRGVLPGPTWQRWAQGFQFLPELIGPAGGYAWCNDIPMPDMINCDGKVVVSVFEVIEEDIRSESGIKASDARDRVQRGLLAHEAWRVENEWWTGTLNPDNPHLNGANPFYPALLQEGGSSGAALGLATSLGLLEQAIAHSDAGKGIIHCTPYVFNAWATRGGIPFRYDGGSPGNSTHIYTPNGNLVIPGYGYDGSAPADIDANAADLQFQTEQFAYATDMVYLLRGPVTIEPDKQSDMSPDITVFGKVAWRATRPWAIYSNGGLRAAVFVDTTTL